MSGGGIFEALGLIALGIMLGTGGYVFLTSVSRVTNAEARARLFGWESAALGKRPGGSEPKGPSAADTHTHIDVRTHRDGASSR
jgi:hypothetical protein